MSAPVKQFPCERVTVTTWRYTQTKGGKQMTVGWSCWCASPWATMSLLSVSTWTQLESAVR